MYMIAIAQRIRVVKWNNATLGILYLLKIKVALRFLEQTLKIEQRKLIS